MSTKYVACSYLGLLVFTAIWTVVSALTAVGAVRVRDKAPAWGWANQFAVSALVGAYCFASLVSRWARREGRRLPQAYLCEWVEVRSFFRYGLPKLSGLDVQWARELLERWAKAA